MKKILAFILSFVLLFSSMAGCSKSSGNKTQDPPSSSSQSTTQNDENSGSNVIRDSYNDLEGADVMILKMTGVLQYQLFYEGFNQEFGVLLGTHKTADLSPAEAVITDQVKAIDEAIASKVASISVGPTGGTGYDEVLKKADKAGIPIFSIDAPVSPEYRVAHINQADAMDVGAYLIASAILISQRMEYDSQSGTTVVEQAHEVMEHFTGDKITIGILSTTVDAPVQNSWILGIEEELKNEVYGGKIETEIKYTNDDLQNAAVQINAFISEGKVDSFLSLTANASVVVGQVLASADTDLKATGVGMPSQQAAYMPSSPGDDPFDYPMPWVLMWDPINVGRVLAAAIEANKTGDYTGEIGGTLVVPASEGYKEATYTTTEHSDGGPEIIAGPPLIFDKTNIGEWKDKF